MHRNLRNALLVAVMALGVWPGIAIGSGGAAASRNFRAEPDQIVFYCGRSKALVDPLVELFERQTGVRVAVRYGRDAQLLALMEEEGANGRADVFWANTTGAMGMAQSRGLLADLPGDIAAMPDAYAVAGADWVPITTRFRVLAYNPQRVSEADLPDSVMDLAGMERFEGRIGWTPTYSSFQDFVTAMRVTQGREAALAWLKGVRELDPKAYSDNTPMIKALAAGEIDIALTNHYYILRMLDEEPNAPVNIHHFRDGDLGNLALVTGAGLLKSSRHREGAERFLRFLLSAEAQSFAAERVKEYPVVRGVDVPDDLVPVDRALRISPHFDFGRLSELEDTLRLMREAGLF